MRQSVDKPSEDDYLKCIKLGSRGENIFEFKNCGSPYFRLIPTIPSFIRVSVYLYTLCRILYICRILSDSLEIIKILDGNRVSWKRTEIDSNQSLDKFY